jgi:hypothetical protein
VKFSSEWTCEERLRATPDEVYERMDWLAIAAEATELLASMIKTPDDLKRPVRARMSDSFIIIEFCKGA